MVSSAAFRAFSCEAFDNGRSFLRADYAVECETATHERTKLLAWLGIALCTLRPAPDGPWHLVPCLTYVCLRFAAGLPTPTLLRVAAASMGSACRTCGAAATSGTSTATSTDTASGAKPAGAAFNTAA